MMEIPCQARGGDVQNGRLALESFRIQAMNESAVHANAHQLSAEIKQRGRILGFDLVGIAPAEASKYRDYFRNWIETQQHGSM